MAFLLSWDYKIYTLMRTEEEVYSYYRKSEWYNILKNKTPIMSSSNQTTSL